MITDILRAVIVERLDRLHGNTWRKEQLLVYLAAKVISLYNAANGVNLPSWKNLCLLSGSPEPENGSGWRTANAKARKAGMTQSRNAKLKS